MRELLADPLTVEMLTGPNVKSVTFEEKVAGPNIKKYQAIENSDSWHLTQPDIDPMAALDAIPAREDDFTAEGNGASRLDPRQGRPPRMRAPRQSAHGVGRSLYRRTC